MQFCPIAFKGIDLDEKDVTSRSNYVSRIRIDAEANEESENFEIRPVVNSENASAT